MGMGYRAGASNSCLLLLDFGQFDRQKHGAHNDYVDARADDSLPFKGMRTGFRKACFTPSESKPLASGAVEGQGGDGVQVVVEAKLGCLREQSNQ